MAQISMLIGIDDQKVSLEDAAAELTAHGLRNAQSMPHIGVISGDADAGKLDEFSRINGVRSIRPEGNYQLPPVREDIPQ